MEISWSKTKEFWAKQSQENPTVVAGIVGMVVTLTGVSIVLLSCGKRRPDSNGPSGWNQTFNQYY